MAVMSYGLAPFFVLNCSDNNLKVFMSTALFGLDGQVYNQSAVLDSQYRLDRSKLDQVGLPRFTTTYALSQLFYNLSLGSAVVSVTLWYWDDLKRGELFWLSVSKIATAFSAFGSLRFLRGDGGGYDDPHYNGIFFVCHNSRFRLFRSL
jgi:hypothetical protein